MTHTIPAHLLERTIRVTVIGCGGNGSVIATGLPYIHQALLAVGHPGGLEVTLIDGDIVSPSNCIRQPFSRTEVGLHKSIVLASRINLFWGLHWKAIPEYLSTAHKTSEADIVIGCVDTRSARATIQELVTGNATTTYWLDIGNGSTGGQFILGQPLNRRNPRRKTRLRTAAELFPEIADGTIPEDNEPSCSALESLHRQSAFINQVLASHALAMLARLLQYGQLEAYGAFLNITTHCVQPITHHSCRRSGAGTASPRSSSTSVQIRPRRSPARQ